MSDTVFLRQLAGQQLRLAAIERQERQEEQDHKLELMLRNLMGWLPPKHLRRRAINQFANMVQQQADQLKVSTDDEIRQVMQKGLANLKQQQTSKRDLALVFACVAEGVRRTLGLWPHPVQLTGAHVLLTGRLAEMQTGEGKTLVAGLAATIMASSGASVHVISTNDYLAERDCEEMAPLFKFFDLSAGHVKGGMEIDERQVAYAQQICYVSGKEVVFDYLKDRLAGHGLLPNRIMQVKRLVSQQHAQGQQKPIIAALHFCIVDEADSVLIDEARTPMVISKDTPSIIELELLHWAIDQARSLVINRDFTLDIAQHDVELAQQLVTPLGSVPSTVRPVWRNLDWQRMILRQALMALHLYQRDIQYIIVDNKIQIVDESTGRVMEDRSWEQGLHQLIETKEGVELTSGRETLAKMTFQRFFRRYFLLSGLTGTGLEVHRELWTVYRLKVCKIPPNKPNQRSYLSNLYCATLDEKYKAIVTDAIRASSQGQPVLIGTRSVEASEAIAQELAARQITHTILNARQDADEAKIVAQAGQTGQVTVATNMAGRGTDIKLNAVSRHAGGLHVILSEFHESSRVDRQLFGRSGRQGDPGTCRAIVCGKDELLKADGGFYLFLLNICRLIFFQEILLKLCVQRVQSIAQKRAYRMRMATLKQDKHLNRQIGFAGKLN